MKVVRDKAGLIEGVVEESIVEEKGVEETVTRNLNVKRDRAGVIDRVVEEPKPDARLGGQVGRR